MNIRVPRTHQHGAAPPPGKDAATRRLDTAWPKQRTAPSPGHTVVLRPDSAVLVGQQTSTDAWGWLPALSVVGALGLLLLALGFTGARLQPLDAAPTQWARWASAFFWTGLLVLFVPLAARLLSAGASRRERIGLVIVFGLGMYLVKVLQYPVMFTYHDEFLHWRTANDIVVNGRLFSDNPLLPASALFPGLEVITSTVAQLSGLSLFSAGIIVLAVARIVMVLGLYLFYEQISRSARIAGLGTLLYMVNPKLIFFDAQFSYESLSLPLTVLALYVLAQRVTAQRAAHHRWTVAALLTLGALAMTHHLTSYAMLLFLGLWTVVTFVRRRSIADADQAPGSITLVFFIVNMVWLLYIATVVVDYLAPHVQGAIRELLLIIRGDLGTRQLFQDHTGVVTPLWERAFGFAATLLILFGLPFGWHWVWKHYRRSALALTLSVATLAYPASLAFRFTQAGSEASDRAAGVVFIALAFVLAVGVVGLVAEHRRYRVALHSVALALVTVIFLGEVIVGAGPAWSRVPGPYLVSADARSIEAQSISAAHWMRTHLGPGNRVAADRMNRLLAGSYGEQYALTHARTETDVSPIFFGLGYGPVEDAIVDQQQIQYLVVDRRLQTDVPRVGIYFEAPEPNALQHKQPISSFALAKFDRLRGLSRVFDSGSIIIYKVGESVSEP